MKVLIACEYSGTVRDAFIKKGHEAISCDILPTEKPGPHHQGDVIEFIKKYGHEFDLIVAHPPCTYLCNSGVSWLYKDVPGKYKTIQETPRWAKMVEGALFFKSLMDCQIPKIAIENPIMHKYAKEIIGAKQSQIIQPWQFGHGETKATCLWLKYLPPLKPTKIVEGRVQRLHKLPPSADRSKLRSMTYQGIANAIAKQWS